MLALAMALALQNASAPELDGHHGWLNTDKPLRMADLRGKIVLLDFWTYCCINCHHVFPDLRRLEEKYAKELVVIGVHSAKFRNERDAENLRKAVLRHDLRHPVVNDADMKIFNAYRATGWPHFVLVDPEGRLYGRVGGEGNYDVLDEHIGKLVKQFDATLDRAVRAFRLEKEEKRPLAFPGK
ncbi:MAG TPA: thioredoxin-like domain-containing protein, partial [Planctomycetota bacterium]|nr:thioredoxin-like domain-containing protein [Planctomycetota bacterium]